MTTLETTATPEEIVARVAPVLRQYAAAGETERRLAPQAVEAMIDAGVFRAWIPKALGGLEMEPAAALRMFEGIAHADGAAGWVASNSSNATLSGRSCPTKARPRSSPTRASCAAWRRSRRAPPCRSRAALASPAAGTSAAAATTPTEWG
jgi:alkylation response protein AidB-like acyl-CoA dehydrogenase